MRFTVELLQWSCFLGSKSLGLLSINLRHLLPQTGSFQIQSYWLIRPLPDPRYHHYISIKKNKKTINLCNVIKECHLNK